MTYTIRPQSLAGCSDYDAEQEYREMVKQAEMDKPIFDALLEEIGRKNAAILSDKGLVLVEREGPTPLCQCGEIGQFDVGECPYQADVNDDPGLHCHRCRECWKNCRDDI